MMELLKLVGLALISLIVLVVGFKVIKALVGGVFRILIGLVFLAGLAWLALQLLTE